MAIISDCSSLVGLNRCGFYKKMYFNTTLREIVMVFSNSKNLFPFEGHCWRHFLFYWMCAILEVEGHYQTENICNAESSYGFCCILDMIMIITSPKIVSYKLSSLQEKLDMKFHSLNNYYNTNRCITRYYLGNLLF